MSLQFSLIGLIASMLVAVYQISMLTESLEQEVVSQLGSTQALIPVAALQGLFLTFIASFFGLKLAEKVNLKLNFKFKRKSMERSIFVGFITALIITVSDRFIFAQYLPNQVLNYMFSPIYFLMSLLYGGIIEEILLRLFVMSLFVLIFWKLFARTRDMFNIPKAVYFSAIILSAILFAAGHLPATIQSLGTSTPIIIRMFLLNGIGGLGYGYLYWKHGLAYAMVAHGVTHIFMQTLFMPILF